MTLPVKSAICCCVLTNNEQQPTAVGTLAFALLEDADAVDAFYWSSATLTTVGYGDFSPGTTGGKWFAVFYMLIGIAVVANALSDIASIPIVRVATPTSSSL